MANDVRWNFALPEGAGKHALSSFRRTPGPAFLDDFRPRSTWAGVYDPKSRQFLAYPSGDSTLLSGAIPENLVPRNGHHDVNNAFGQITLKDYDNPAFTIKNWENDSLSVDFSAPFNRRMPWIGGDVVPQHMQEPIMDALRQATNRRVWPDQ
ncbi:hypothetical protein [Streptosporangium sp. KLBMP 9127]|nr:hypothetical protein [Streptosporangium sp. KLBMP 9127]